MTPEQIEAEAEALFQAEQTGIQRGLISLANPLAGLDQAYAIQAAFVARRQIAGRKAIGWKIGLTSRAMQDALKITTPDSGILMDDMLFETGATVPKDRFIQPRVEAEIAFVLKAPLRGTNTTRADVLAATDYVSAALEILDTRIRRADPLTGQTRSIVDTISDNAANAGIVLGNERKGLDAIDLRWVAAIVKRDGIVEETGLGAGVLDDPATSVLWLVHRLARYGMGMAAGEIVLSGSFIRPIEAPPGSHFEADFGTFGRVDLTFA